MLNAAVTAAVLANG